MGCCMSKISANTKNLKQIKEPEAYTYVQEKLFISHCPKRVSPLLLPPHKNQFLPIPIPEKFIPIPIPIPDKPSLPPPPLIQSSTTTSNSSLSSSSSSLSTASSISKEKSFSNDFLRACYQENSHVVRINSLRESSLSLKITKPGFPTRSNSPVNLNRYQSTPNRVCKRIREPSPNHRALTRQKSFRVEQEKVIVSSSDSLTKGKFLKSPSPSRRFGNHLSSSDLSCREKNRSETRIHRIDSKIDETVIKEVIGNKKESVAPMFEEMGNPMIDLDCFIFI